MNGEPGEIRMIGIWLVGARGGVATTAAVGLSALRRGLIGPTGLLSELPEFQNIALAPWDRFVVGGHEIRDRPLWEQARWLAESRAMEPRLVEACAGDLEEIDARVRPGLLRHSGAAVESLATLALPRDASPRAAIDRLKSDLAEFASAGGLGHMVLVNVASTEPPVDAAALPPAWYELEPMLADWDDCPLPASSLYAIAAIELGYSAINFTPSLGSAPAALDDLARRRGTRHMGCDGKTGETLMKSVLAPMFRRRNLDVRSWVGHNIFGNLDGVVLNDPANKASKAASKDHLVGEILGYKPQTLVSIEYIESMGDWKTAWDHIHFGGFLGTPMTLQFIWQGCDSILAAPLVLDLVRFTELAWRRGEVGLMTQLASFFKSPYGVAEHDFTQQFQMLEAWATAGMD
jgi:myo-inositol-1-phosphate synthase